VDATQSFLFRLKFQLTFKFVNEVAIGFQRTKIFLRARTVVLLFIHTEKKLISPRILSLKILYKGPKSGQEMNIHFKHFIHRSKNGLKMNIH